MTKDNTPGGLVHVVDDDVSIRRSLDFLLQSAGYRVQCWIDGEEFLKRADKDTPACVLLDMRMPGIDGLAVLERMTEQGIEFPVIMLTGHGDITIAVRAMKTGAVDFIEKPFDRDILLRSIAAAFKRLADHGSLREEQAWAASEIAKLTEREREVLDGLACGYPNKTIAYDLGISSRTVEVYRASIMAKLEGNYFADVLRIAFKGGLGDESVWGQAHGVGQKRA